MKGVTLTAEEWAAVLELRAAFHGMAELTWLTAHEIEGEPESVGMSRDRLRALVALADHGAEAGALDVDGMALTGRGRLLPVAGR